MPDRKPPAKAPIANCGHSATSDIIGHLVTRLEVEAAKSGGTLDSGEFRAIATRFMAEEMPRFQSVFQRSYDECSKRREEARWSGERRNPFDRVLIKRIAHLFPLRPGDDGGIGLLSRRVIPGISVAIDKMIGPMLYEQCQRKTRGIMDRHTGPDGVDWNAVYADPETHQLSNDVLLVMSHYFSDFERRRAWFQDLINSQLSPPLPEDNNDHWQLGNHGFSEMMRAMFMTLASDMDRHPAQFRKRYGEQTVNELQEFLRRLAMTV